MKLDVLIFKEQTPEMPELLAFLRSLGLKAEAISDPKEFLAKVKTAKPSLCALDLTAENGPVFGALASTLRKVLGPSLPLLAFVDKDRDPLIAQAFRAGVSTIVPKPFTNLDLTAKLSLHLSSVQAPKRRVKVALPAIVDWFFERMSPVMADLSNVLEYFPEVETQLKFFAEKLAAREEMFIAMVSARRKSEGNLDITQAMRLWGVENVRQLIVATRLAETTQSDLFFWDEAKKAPNANPKAFIPFAARAAEHVSDEAKYSQVAFSSGLVLDLLNILAEPLEVDRKLFLRRQLETGFVAALRMADVGFKTGTRLKELALEKHILTTLLMREAGKAAMALHFADYSEFRSRCERKKVPPLVQRFSEDVKYKINHALMGSLLAQTMPGLSEASKAVLFADAPFLLKERPQDRDPHAVASVCNSVLLGDPQAVSV